MFRLWRLINAENGTVICRDPGGQREKNGAMLDAGRRGFAAFWGEDCNLPGIDESQ